MTRKFFVRNQRETSKLAKLLAQEIIKKPLKTKAALIIGLEGELGAGKTTFIKAFARGLGIRKRLTSPTFVILKRYAIRNKQHANIYHIDCYRVKNPRDILLLDFQEIISNPQNIVIIEWAERVKKILPKDTLWIHFKIVSEKERRVIMSNF